MQVDRYRCPKCEVSILAREVEESVYVWPPGVEPNSARHGMTRVVLRPGPLLCHSSAHDRPVGMKRESVNLDVLAIRRLYGQEVIRGD